MRSRHISALVLTIALAIPVSLSSSTSAQAAPQAAETPVEAAAAAATDPTTRMPTDVPSKRTPWVLDGEVTKIVQVGDTMIAAGLFTTVAEPMNGTQYPRANIFAFDKSTGIVSQTFKPTFDGQVQQLMEGPIVGGQPTVYVAGDFTKVNGVGPNHIQLLNVNTGLAVPSFRAPSTNGGIETIELLGNNRLFIGGFFTRIAGVAHGQLGTLNATTGALDPYLNITVSGHHNNTGTGAQGPVGPRESGVSLSPAGDRLVVIGNFRTVGGVTRNQIVMIDLNAGSPSVSSTWATTQYAPICSQNAFDSYMRDVEMSPDGSYFVVATTGGPHPPNLCDTATRWETRAVGTTLLPTWTANSGGDTLWGVGISEAAVFVGGHNRWMNNPTGTDSARQGAVPRPGLSALDPLTGVPLKWNPGRNPRGEAAYEVYPTNDGIYLVSDTDWIGDRRYQRPRIAFFPYSEGSNIASTTTGSLPGNVYIASPSTSNVIYRVNAGGAQVAATDGGADWVSDNSATSPYHNTGSVTATRGALTSADLVNVPSTTPLGIWTSERNDPSGGNEMSWTFPVSAGASTQVRLYFAARSTVTRRFNVLIDGVTKMNNYDGTSSDPGLNKGIMKSFDVTADGTLNIDFTRPNGNPGTPFINAIEILTSTSEATNANVVTFDGTTVTNQASQTTANFDWTNVRGAVMVGRTLFYGGTESMLYKRTFDGVDFGEPIAVNPYVDPLWSTVETGSGTAGQTYAGVLPTFYSQLGTVTGSFYSNGRLYYTRSGANSLFWRYFVPDSGIVNPIENTVTGGDITWTNAKGMFLDGNRLYVVSSVNGSLSRIDFVNGAPSGTSTVVNSKATGGIDWRGRALFLASILPNVGPTASFTETCTDVTCVFDSSASSDSDGSIASYQWEFGDGDTSGAASPDHDYDSTGTYTVSLTVTDDAGVEATTSHEVSVVKPNVAPTAAFTIDCTYLDCTFDGSGSTDSDGTVNAYAWDFGDTGTDTTSPATHTFAAPGDYTVELTVTDNEGLDNTVTRSVTVNAEPAASTVAYVGSSVFSGNASTPHTTVPATVSVGDRLVMVLSLAASDRVLSNPTGVTGWTVLGTSSTTGMATTTYTKLAEPLDAGKTVTVTTNLATKYTMTVAAYSGARSGAVVSARFAETVNRAGHATPVVTAAPGAWVVSHWADKTSLTTGFTLPAVVTSRQAACAPTTGRVCSVLADSAGAVPAGSYGNLTATAKDAAAADSPTNNATTWSIVLRTVDPNVLPHAEFTHTCTSLMCDFDASTSSDSDGNVASYAWDFDDGDTATGVSPSNGFPDDGDYEVSLTVTDDQGGQTTTTETVSVTRTNAAPTAAYTSVCRYLVCTFDAATSADDETVDSYAWDFGDDVTETGVAPSHAFDATGSYQVALTVTDNDGASTTLTKTISVTAVEPIARVGSTVNNGNVASPNSTIPAAASAGDRLVMILSLNATNRVQSAPTGTTGWTLVDTAQSGTTTGMVTTVYTKVAAAGDGGRVVRVPLDLAAKYTLTVAAYSGDMLAPNFVKASETVVRANHTTPSTLVDDDAVAGDWGLSYWADRSSATTAFALPGSVTQREVACAPLAGRVCSVLADSDGGVAAGPYGGLVATADSAQSAATMWTILLRQDPA